MRNVNWDNIEASVDGGGFKKLEPGGYVARIVSATDNPAREYVEVVWDIAEGEDAGHYSDQWGIDHPYAHNLYMSYKDTALGMLKGRLKAIEASNPGFDPFAAWDGARLDMFTNRLVGINLQEEEYEDRNGDVRTRLTVCQVVPAQDVRDGKVSVRPTKTLDGKNTKQTARAVEADDIEVPFN